MSQPYKDSLLMLYSKSQKVKAKQTVGLFLKLSIIQHDKARQNFSKDELEFSLLK